jgi:hypothetical protein
LFLQLGHEEGGLMIESPDGIRVAQTLKKLPIIDPRIKPRLIEITGFSTKKSKFIT